MTIAWNVPFVHEGRAVGGSSRLRIRLQKAIEGILPVYPGKIVWSAMREAGMPMACVNEGHAYLERKWTGARFRLLICFHGWSGGRVAEGQVMWDHKRKQWILEVSASRGSGGGSSSDGSVCDWTA